jgi:tRNA A-37 threonylcarbamoyl transferase component Bud32
VTAGLVRDAVARYELGRRLGHGGMGVVYEAFDRERNRDVAIKVYRHDDEVTLARVRRIVERLRGVRHVNVVEVVELLEDGDAPVLVMERVDGEDMLSYVAGRWRSEPPDAASSRPVRCDVARLRSCLAQLGAGLIELHRRGVVHRDLKPANLRVTAEGRLVILDFSLSDDRGGDGDAAGSIGYMAPEQAIADAVIGPAVDWYAVGVVAYQALTGRLPFDGPPQRVLQEKAQRAPVPVDELVAGAPPELVALCRALLVPDPDRRPREEELARMLGLAERAPTSPAAPPTARRRARAVERVMDRLATAAADGRAALVALVGEAGIGRTATVAGVVDAFRAAWPDGVVLAIDGRRAPLDGLAAELASAWARLGEAEQRAIVPEHAGALAALLPALGTVPAIAAASASARVTVTDAIDALREVLQLLSRRRPVLLAIDDLDAFDVDARTVLADALRGPDTPAVLLVATAADEARLPPIERLLTMPLEWSSRRDVEDLLASWELPPEIARATLDRCNGNPALAVELARAWSIGEVPPDGGLVDVLAARIGRLTPPARDLLVAIARVGDAVGPRALARALDLDAPALDAALVALERGGLVTTTQRPGGVAVAPPSRPVEAALAAAIAPRDAARVARALAVDGDALAPALRARLWHEAGDAARAAEHAVIGADDARRRLRFGEAMALYQLAVDGGRVAHERALAECAAACGQGAIAARAFAAAAGHATDAADALGLAVRAAEHHVLAGEVDRGVDGFARALATIGIGLAASPGRAIPRLLARRAWLRVRGVRFQRRPDAEVAPYDLAGADACLSATYHLGVLETVVGAELQARTLAHTLRLGEPERLGRAAVLEAIYLTCQGAVARAERLVAIARRTADEIGSASLASFTLLGLAGLEFFHRNRFAAALPLFDARLRNVRADPAAPGWSLDLVQTYACMTLAYLGDVHELTRRVHALVREAERRGDRYAATIFRVRTNLAWLARGDDAGADEALAIADRQWPFESGRFRVPDYYRLYARVERALWGGDPAAAARALDAGFAPLERSMLTRVHHVRAEACSLGARTAIATATAGTARSAARRWIGRLDRNVVPVAGVWSSLLAGCAALRDRDPAAAIEPLRAAVVRADAIALGIHAAAARVRLGEALGADGAGEIDRALHDLSRLGVTDVTRTIAMVAPV